jgi:hypothetical protein
VLGLFVGLIGLITIGPKGDIRLDLVFLDDPEPRASGFPSLFSGIPPFP